MKKSYHVENFPKRGALPLCASCNRLTRFSSKRQNRGNADSVAARASKERRPDLLNSAVLSCDCNDDAVTPLNDKNGRNDGRDDEAENKTKTPTKTPPVEASVSPEMQQMMIMMMMKTTTPASGHPIHTVVSGVTDNRKRRARGLLVANGNGDDDALPLPSHASMHWLHNHSPTLPSATNSSPATSTSNSSPNVMQTPTSADSDSSVFQSQISSVVDFSFDLDASAARAASSSLADLTHFRAQLISTSCCSDTDDIDRFDSCRCSSDDEGPNIVFDDVAPPIEPKAQQQSYAHVTLAESISTDGGGPVASSKDSDWEFDIQPSPL